MLNAVNFKQLRLTRGQGINRARAGVAILQQEFHLRVATADCSSLFCCDPQEGGEGSQERRSKLQGMKVLLRCLVLD